MIEPISTKATLRLAVLSAACLTGIMISRPASAQEQTVAPLRTICKEDYKKHCAGVMPGGGAIRECMKNNMDKLTPECRAGLEAWKKSKEKS